MKKICNKVQRECVTDEIVDASEPEPTLIVETEPNYWSNGHYHEGSKPYIDPTAVWKLPIGTKLYASPPSVPDGHVHVQVSGLTGSGKSAVAGEIEIALRAIGLDVEWADSESEKRLTHADYVSALELYKPKVRIFEKNIPRATPTPPEPPADVARDAARLNWLDKQNTPHGLGWEVIQMPAGNVHIHTVVGEKVEAKFKSIREAIDAARERQGGE